MMHRLALVADSHFDEHSRFDECIRIHDWILEDLQARPKVDAILHAGDIFERKSSPRERLAVARWLIGAARLAPVIVAQGNHDCDDDLRLFSRLDTTHRISICEHPDAFTLEAGLRVAVLPWPRKGHLVARGIGDGREELRTVLRGLGRLSAPLVLLAHAMVRGSRTSAGQPLVGCDFELGLEDLSLVDADAYLLGHIHAGQDWMIEREGSTPAPVIYPGSPRRTAFGEVEEKGYVIVTLDDDGPRPTVSFERIATPATPMIHIDGVYNGGMMIVTESPPAGAEVRLRYEVAADEQEAAKRSAEAVRDLLLAEGAVSVKLEPQVTTTVRARAPEVAAARTLREKLCLYWAAKGVMPEPERAERLLAMAEGMEAENG